MSSTISERLNISNEILELKFGKSFTNSTNSNSKFISNKNAFNNNSTNESYHSIRYDFKPVSVDTSQTATIEFNEKNKVTVTAPNVESSGTPYTVFQGSRKPHLKECVLVIDHETGDFTLERLTNNIVVKRTRAEVNSKSKILNQQRPITPACTSQKSVSPKLQNQTNNNSNKSSPNTNSVPCSSYRKENKKDIPSTTMNSMPIFNSTTLNVNSSNVNITKSTFANNDYNKIGVLSSSSSSSSSDEDDSSSSSQSSSSEDEKSFDKNKTNINENTINKPVSSMDFSSSSSSEIDSDDEKLNSLNNNLLNSLNDSLSNVGIGNNNSNQFNNNQFNNNQFSNNQFSNNQFNNNQFNNNGVVGFSMPKLSVLNDDLQLSESGSDSE